MRSYSLLRLALLIPVVAVLLGCGGSGGRERITGTIKFKGQLLDKGTIAFHPQDTSGGATFEGSTITNGQYEVPAKQGLLPGKYKVVISSPDATAKADPLPGESGPLAKDRIPPEFGTAGNKVVEVKKGGPNVFDFDIP